MTTAPQEFPQRTAAIPIWPAILLAILIPEAAVLDRPVATFVRDTGLKTYLTGHWPTLLLLIRVPGNFWSYTIPACLWLLVLSPSRISPAPVPGERIRLGMSIAVLAAILCTVLNILATLRLPNDAMWTSALTLSLPHDTLWTWLAAAATIALAAWMLLGSKLPRERWEQTAVVFLAGILSGSNWLLKWCFGRTRPFQLNTTPFEFHPFDGGLHGLAGHPPRPFSFPSGDVSLAFAMLAALSWIVPRHRPLFWALALIVLLERLSENAHYFSDTIAGAALGWTSAWAAVCVVYANQGRREQPGRS